MIDKRDVRIFASLRSSGRMKLTQLSREIGLPVSTIFDRMKSSAAIQRHATLIDFHVLGFGVKAIVLLKVAKGYRDALHDHLMSHFHINNLSKVNNGFDYYVECVFHTMQDLEEFLESLEEKYHIKQKTVYYIVKDLKREAFLSDPATCDYVLTGASPKGDGF